MNTLRVHLLVLLLSLAACGKKNTSETVPAAGDSSIVLSREQIEMAEIRTGAVEKRVLSEVVECTGTVALPPQSRISVTFPMEGYIRAVKVVPGDYVTKGHELAVIGHPGIINLQKNYLEQKQQLDYYREEFKRQGELAVEQAASMKKMQLAESDFKTREIEVKSMEEELKLVGIDGTSLRADNLKSEVTLYAPVSGYISKSNANPGRYIDPKEEIFEILDKEHLNLSLSLFEKDLMKIRKGQLVHFHPAGQDRSDFNASVESIGQIVDKDSRTVLVQAHIINPDPMLVQGMYVNATLLLNPETVYAVPVTALTREDDAYFVFRAEQGRFLKIPVTIGIERDDYVELKNPPADLIQGTIVTSGAYYIASEASAVE